MATKRETLLTQSGLDALNQEIEVLKTVKRTENLLALKEAREQGDLSENADYDAARNEQARIEGRIKEIEGILKKYKLIKNTAGSQVEIGKTVKIVFVSNKLEREFELVGTIEADPRKNKISIDSPLGKSLRGHEKGDTVTYKTDAGKSIQVQIIDVK